MAMNEAQSQQMQLALQLRTVAQTLEGAFGLQPDPRGVKPRGVAGCRILDMRYEPDERCVILYQLGEHMVVGTLRWDRPDVKWSEPAQMIPSLGMGAYLFPHDPALPGLAAALETQAMAHALAEGLPECGEGAYRVLRCRAVPLRYRLGRRCTLRLDLWLRNVKSGVVVHRTLIGKVYHDGAKAASVYGSMAMLSGTPPVREGRIAVARAVAFLPALAMILQEPMDGTPLDLWLSCREDEATADNSPGGNGVVRAATALAALHTSGLATERQRAVAVEIARLQSRAAQVARADATLGARMSELAATLTARLERLSEWNAEVSFVHGDCKPSQFLLGATQVALLDFDHCGMADPAVDVGTFLATLRQQGLRRSLKAESREGTYVVLEGRFLDAYCAVSGRGADFRSRAAWYQAAALLRKAQRSFARSPRSPLPAGLVAEAWRCLRH